MVDPSDLIVEAYVENSPVNFNDPMGLDTQIQIGFTEVTPGFGRFHQRITSS